MKRFVLNISFLLLFFCNVFAHEDNFDLIFEVMRQEAILHNRSEEIKRLFHVCYERVLVPDGSISRKIDERTSYTQNTYRTEQHRRPSCLDSDIQALKNLENKERIGIEDACKSIRTITHEQGDVAVKSAYYDGKTALNYCYTEEIYEQLIRCGVPGQWKVWAYFNPWSAIALGATSITAIIVAYYYVTESGFMKKTIEK